MVLHDPTLIRLWGLERPVAELTWPELDALGHGDERIPTLAQVLEQVPVELMVDFTGPEVVPGALEAVRAAGALERSLFVSDHRDALRQLRALSPAARIGLTWMEDTPPPLDLLAELAAECWNPWYPLATPARVEAAHRAGYRVTTWTVDERADMAALAALGVDALVSNRISELVAVLDGLG